MQLSGIKKGPLKGPFFRRWVCFICCIVYFINYCWNNLLVLYLESLDLPLKNVVEGSTKCRPLLNFSGSKSNPVNHFWDISKLGDLSTVGLKKKLLSHLHRRSRSLVTCINIISLILSLKRLL